MKPINLTCLTRAVINENHHGDTRHNHQTSAETCQVFEKSSRWSPLIERAWIGRQHVDLKAEAEDVNETLEFIRYTLATAKPDMSHPRHCQPQPLRGHRSQLTSPSRRHVT